MRYGFEDVKDSLSPALREKIERGEQLTPEEILEVKLALDLGDTCGCDDDHHGRDYLQDMDAKRANFSE